MGLVHITSWYPQLNGSHFDLPPSPLSTKWLDWVKKWCELWRMHTSPIQQGVFYTSLKKQENLQTKHNGNVDRLIIIQWPWKLVQLDSHLDWLQWRLFIKMATDWQVSEVRTLSDLRPGRGLGDQCKSSEFLQELCISGFPCFWVSPTCFRAK